MSTSVRMLTAGLTLVLIAGMTPATATAEEPAPAPPQASTDKRVDGKLDPVAPMSVTVIQEEPARAGGLGQVTIPLTRRADVGPRLRNLTTRVQAPKGARLTQVTGKQWRCSTTRASAICRTPSLAPSANPSPVFATFAVRKSWKKPKIRLTADAKWSGGPVRVRKGKPWLVSSSAAVEVNQPLRVRLSSASGKRIVLATNGPDTSRQFALQAEIANIDGSQVSARWQQTRGPKTQFTLPRQFDHISEQVGQVVQVPDSLRSNATLGYRVVVEGNGQRVVRDITVRALVNRLDTTSAPRNHLLKNLATATKKPQKTVGHQLRSSNGVRLTAKRWQVRIGAPVTVRLRTSRPVRSVEWSIDGKPAGTGRALRFTAPQTAVTTTLVAAVITLRDGTVLQESAAVRTKTPRPISGGGSSKANIDAVCQIVREVQGGFNSLTIKLAQGQALVIPKGGASVDKPTFSKTCDERWAVNVSKATITHQAAQFNNVSAAITAETGLKISQADMLLPERLQVGSIKEVTLKATGDKSTTAPLINGEWELLDGSLAIPPIGPTKINGLGWVPLPDGFSFPTNSSVVSFLNEDPDDPRLKDGTLQIAQKATGPNDASISLSANNIDSSWNRVDVTVANISLGSTAGGDTLMAAGTGTLMMGETGSSVDIDITCTKSAADCELFSGFVVNDLHLKISREVLGLYGEAGIRYSDPVKTFDFALAGSYTSAKNWELKARSTSDWELFNGMSLSDLSGNVSMTPIKDKKDQSQLELGLTGTLKGLQFADSVRVQSLATTITNRCPQTAKNCKTGAVHFGIDAKVSVDAPTGPLSLSAGTLLDLTNGTFTFDFGYQNMQIGPKDLMINKADFVLTNEPGGTCTPRGDSPKPSNPKVLSVTLKAQAKVFGADVTVAGTTSKAGTCFWGYPGPIDMAGGMKAKQGVLAFTSYENGADLSIPGEQEPITLGGNRVQVSGDFALPDPIMVMFDIPGGSDALGHLTYTGTYDFQQKAINFELDYTPTKEIVMYQGNGSKFTLDDVGFEVAYSSAAKTAKVVAVADGSLWITGGGGLAESRTPMGVSLGFEIATDGISVKLQAGLITDKNGVKTPIQNAFGQQGLLVNTLSVALKLAAPITSSELAVNADVRLPGRWVENIGVKDQTRVSAAFKIAKEDPCLKIQIGEEAVAARATVVDIANKGFLTAQYFTIVIAPKGCTLPVGAKDEEYVQPGYAFAFDGKILGATLQVAINSSINDGLVIKGDIKIPAIDLYAVKLGGTTPGSPLTITMDINSKANQYNVKFDAGIDFGQPDRGLGARVRVRGMLDTSRDDYMSLSIAGSSSTKLVAIAVDIPALNVDLRIAKPGKPSSLNYAHVHADMVARVLGLGIQAGGDLEYGEGQLLNLRVYAGAAIDIVIAEATGNAEFNYCLGRLTDLGQDGSRCNVFTGKQGAKPAYRVGFYGHFRFLWWTKPYTWTAYDQRGAEGTVPVPEPVVEPEYVPGVIPELKPDVTDPKQLQGGVNDIKWEASKTYIKTVFPATVMGVQACQKARLGAEWNPTPQNPNPQPLASNPAPGDTCGLVVDAVIGAGATQRTQVICTPANCTAKTGPLTGKVLAADGPDGQQVAEGRKALLTGLRTPPGLVPGGATLDLSTKIYKFEGIYSSTGEYSLWPASTQFLLFRNSTQIWSSRKFINQAADGYRVAPDGRLQGMTKTGNVMWSIGTAVPDPSKDQVFLFLNDGFRVFRGADTDNPTVLWGINSNKQCIPEGARCDTYTGPPL